MQIHFITQGCSTNNSESEVMKGLLKEAGFTITSNEKDADLIVLNICTVKGESTALKQIRKYRNKKLVIAGCISKPLLDEIKQLVPTASLISTHNIKDIVNIVYSKSRNMPLEKLEFSSEVKINLPRVRQNPIVAIIPILSGCNHYCTYCSVRLIKGKLVSYPKKAILQDIKKSLEEGCKEVWITSQDNACYGLDKGKPELPRLLNEILGLPNDFKLRLGMMNPDNIKPILNDLIKIYNNDKMFKFLHLPIQSGNDEVLKNMNRNYSVKDFLKIISRFKTAVPNIAISTDIIVGFPGETEQQFKGSLKVVSELQPDHLNRSRFKIRPGTKASSMPDQLHSRIIKDRSRLLTDTFTKIALQKNKSWLGWQGSVLIDEKGKNNTWIGRNFAYKPVILNSKHKLGDIVKVKIRKVTAHDLRA